MIAVANRTETVARIKHAFDRKQVHIDEPCDPERTLHIDSKVLEEAAAAAEPVSGIVAARGGGHEPNSPRNNKPSCCAHRWTAWAGLAKRVSEYRT